MNASPLAVPSTPFETVLGLIAVYLTLTFLLICWFSIPTFKVSGLSSGLSLGTFLGSINKWKLMLPETLLWVFT